LYVFFSRGGAQKKRKAKGGEDYFESLKKEVTIDEHRITLEELTARFQTNIETGLTAQQAQETLTKNGRNALTPPPEVPEWVKFGKLLFGGFSGLLWVSSNTKKEISLEIQMNEIGCCDSLFDRLWSSNCFGSNNTER
jgi:hypothetical protein